MGILCALGVVGIGLTLTWGNTTTMGQAPIATLDPTSSNNLGLPIPGGTRPSRLQAIPLYQQQDVLLLLNHTPPARTFIQTLLRTFSPQQATAAALSQYAQNLADLRTFAARLHVDYEAQIAAITPLFTGTIKLTVQADRLSAINQLPEVNALLLINRAAVPIDGVPPAGIPPEEYPVDTPSASTQ